jgi:hypothetical protein
MPTVGTALLRRCSVNGRALNALAASVIGLFKAEQMLMPGCPHCPHCPLS